MENFETRNDSAKLVHVNFSDQLRLSIVHRPKQMPYFLIVSTPLQMPIHTKPRKSDVDP